MFVLEAFTSTWFFVSQDDLTKAKQALITSKTEEEFEAKLHYLGII